MCVLRKRILKALAYDIFLRQRDPDLVGMRSNNKSTTAMGPCSIAGEHKRNNCWVYGSSKELYIDGLINLCIVR